MQINFLTNNKNDKSGSYRIWVKDLNKTIQELGWESKVFTNINDIPSNTDIIILCKSCYQVASTVKQKLINAKIGAINIPADYYNRDIDFVIVGSPEEYVSISSYQHVFIYPLIERKFENIERRVHNNNSEFFNICFHGHYPHLFKFEPFLKNAIEYFDQNHKKVCLKVITGNPKFDWKTGKPNVKIEMHDYDQNFVEIVQSCDIGIVPNVSDIRVFINDIDKLVSTDYGLYKTDFFLRMKNKSNAGRAYVFYQLGLPVIHDLSPSSFELMSKTNQLICAHDTKSYLREMVKLLNPEFRNSVSIINKKTFEQFYNPKEKAVELIEKIRGI
jgi:hypothetical protein